MPKILVVSDDVFIRILLERTLNALPETDTVTTSGTKCAIRVLSTTPGFDLLITDYDLNEISTGIALANAAKGLVPGIKIIIMSGYTREYITNLPDGIVFLSKPFQLDQLKKIFAEMGLK